MLRDFFRGQRAHRPDDAEIARELRDHLELEQEEQAARGLLRNPVYALTATITLALGIGAATAVCRAPGCSGACSSAAVPELRQRIPGLLVALRSGARSMVEVEASTEWRTSLQRATGSELVNGFLVSPKLLSMIAAPFAAGHGFAPDADTPGREGVVVL